MLRQLIKIANKLDELGLNEEADELDSVIDDLSDSDLPLDGDESVDDHFSKDEITDDVVTDDFSIDDSDDDDDDDCEIPADVMREILDALEEGASPDERAKARDLARQCMAQTLHEDMGGSDIPGEA